MVFKRRDKRPISRVVSDFFWPKGGWTRAFHYVKHRVRRLPDPPHRIARGIFAGVFVTFTPLFGFHFVVAITLAWIMRGNIIAALLSTFVGNPLTFLPIAAISLQTGYFLLGMGDPQGTEVHHTLGQAFVGAGGDLKENLFALFTGAPADWHDLRIFYDEVFFPYLVGSVIPGTIAGTIGYYVSLPLIQAYKNRRKGAIKAKWAAVKEKAAAKADAKKKPD